MCRIMLASNNILSVITEAELRKMLWRFHRLNGGAGAGASWLEDGKVMFVKSSVPDYSMQQIACENSLWDLFSTAQNHSSTNYPFLMHIRGTTQVDVFLNHPHQVKPLTEPYNVFGNNILTKTDGGIVVHNGDTPSDFVKYMQTRLGSSFGTSVPKEQKSKVIDTQVIANYVNSYGMNGLQKSITDENAKIGSVVYYSPNLIQVLCGWTDDAKKQERLYFLRWKNNAWMIVSELPVGIENVPDVIVEIKPGLHNLHEILNLSATAVESTRLELPESNGSPQARELQRVLKEYLGEYSKKEIKISVGENGRISFS